MTDEAYRPRTTVGPNMFYPQVWAMYREQGWTALPLPKHAKHPPPSGFTGHGAMRPELTDIDQWRHDKAYEFGNVALRMPKNVIGIDVDVYNGGDKTLAELEARLGPLPKTWSSSSKTDGSRIMYFRVETGKRWRGDLGAGIDIIQSTHRYAVAPPSIHPDGNRYKWWNKQGRSTGRIPSRNELTVLPKDWQAEVDRKGASSGDMPPQDITDAETQAWLDARPQSEAYPCGLMESGFQIAKEKLHVSGHDVAKDATWQLVNLAREGHRGINRALSEVESAFIKAVKDRRANEEEARDEFARLVTSAVGKARTMDELPPCYCVGAEDVEAESDDEKLAAFEAEFLTTDDLDQIEPPKYLIKGQLTKNTTVRMNGAPGSNKSITALDMAGCIGAGMDWKGHKVRQGKVVYLYAEGREGLPRRVRAWEIHNGRKMTDVVFLPRPVLIANKAEWRRLIAICAKLEPVLIVLDTQARIFAGIVENDNAEMGLAFEEAIEKLRRETEACVLMVHHSTGETEKGRGASVITGALNTELFVERDGNVVTLKNTKEKDEADSTVVRMERLILDSGLKDEDGDPLTSVVLRLMPEMEKAGFTLTKSLNVHKQTIVDFVRRAETGVRQSEAKRALVPTKLAESTFKRHWRELIEAGVLKKANVFYSVDEEALDKYTKEQS